MEKGKGQSVQKIGVWIIVIDALLSFAMAMYMTFANFLLTDVAQIDVGVSATIISVAAILSIVAMFVSGALVNNTHSRFGKFTPWIVVSFPLMCIGTFLMMFNTGIEWLTIAIAGFGCLVYNFALNPAVTSKYGMYNSIAGPDDEKRDLFMSRSWTGVNVGGVITGAILVPLIMFFGQDNEILGYRVVQVIFLIVTCVGIGFLVKIGRPYDVSDRSAGVDDVKFSTMLKALVANRPALSVFVGDCFRYTSSQFLMLVMAYYMAYVLGDMELMSIYLILACVAQIIGSFLTPFAVKWAKGRKRLCIICSIASGVMYLFVAATGMSFLGLMIPVFFGMLFGAAADSVGMLLYVGAGEAFLAKTGEDTRPFMLSMQFVAQGVGAALAGTLIGVALTLSNYVTDMPMIGADAQTMAMCVAVIGGACMIAYAISLLFYGATDKQIEEYTLQNADRGFSD